MKKIVVITGASSGIGYHTAAAFAKDGYQVYGLSRRAEGPPGVKLISVDLTDEAAVERAFAQIKDEAGQIDILINNAGFGISGAVEFTELDEARSQFAVNFFAAAACIEYALPLLRPAKGWIINISSVAAVYPLPFQAYYSAAKAALRALSLALMNEVKSFDIGVSTLMLGDTNTGFTAARVKQERGDNLYGGTISRSVAGAEKDEETGMTPQMVGEKIFSLATRRHLKPLYTVGTAYKLLVFLERILPKRFAFWIVGKIYIKRQ
jgi:short-subunit dehydrogenase